MDVKIIFLIVYFQCFGSTIAPLPEYTPAVLINSDDFTRNELIALYFHQAYTYQEIIALLFTVHGIRISLRHVKTICRKLNLRRRLQVTDETLLNAIEVIQSELKGSGKCLGYKSMWKRLLNKNIKITQHMVRRIILTIDPEGVELRKRKRLKRRDYVNPGPNFVWHIDGYDKLKPYGFAIHGGIDGFSRRVLWLEVGPTNNNPWVIAKYYLETALSLNTIPCIIRADKGTENVKVERMQKFLRRDHDDIFNGDSSFMYGRSTANQRIECWWGMLRKQCINFWIGFFKDMVSVGLLNLNDQLQARAIKFCFMKVLQREIHRTAVEWNEHRIRPTKNAETVAGKPDLMFFCPDMYDTEDFGKCLHLEEAKMIMNQTFEEIPNRHDDVEFAQFVALLLDPFDEPQDRDECLELYVRILEAVHDLEED